MPFSEDLTKKAQQVAGAAAEKAKDLAGTATEMAKAAIDTAKMNMEILSEQLTLIPTAGQDERLCWEFKCRTDDERHVLIYVNAVTGQQEKILLLLEDENGTLTL